jgi:glycopeptide antibiotics resistance protein
LTPAGVIDLHDVAEYLGDVAFLVPGIALAVIAAIILAPRVGRAVGGGRGGGALLVFGLGLILSATLTPSAEALRSGAVGSGVCDLTRFGPASLRSILTLEDPGFNILLFLPLGGAIGLIGPRRTRFGLLAGAIVLSPAIELIQLVVTRLDRACQSSDVFDNLTGLAVGFVVGSLAGWLVSSVMPPDGA